MQNPLIIPSARKGGRRHAYTIVMSHDLDDYRMMPHQVRRDLHVSKIRTLYFDPNQIKEGYDPANFFCSAETDKASPCGTHFGLIFNRETKGLYASPLSILATGFLSDFDPEEDSLDIIQLIPEFNGYKQMCALLSTLGQQGIYAALSSAPFEAIAEHIAEDAFTSLVSIILCLKHVRNNPVADSDGYLQRSFKLRDQEGVLHEFLAACGISYNMLKSEGLIHLNRLKK